MEIIYPMFAMVFLTFVVGLSLGGSRIISVRMKHVDPSYYKLLSGGSPPEYVQKLSRNLSNLLEVPVLFYAVALVIITLGINSPLLNGLAWSFFGLRVLHSLIHITYNNTFHRFFAYLFSSLVVLAMWVQVVIVVSKNI